MARASNLQGRFGLYAVSSAEAEVVLAGVDSREVCVGKLLVL